MFKIWNRRTLQYIDWLLIAVVFVIFCFGILSITNATSQVFTGDENSLSEYLSKMDFTSPGWQVVSFVIGIVLIALLLIIDYNNLRDYTDIIYWCSVVLLAIVLVLGSNQRGATGWIMIGGKGFQPSEICKVTIIVVLAKILAQQTELHSNGITEFRQLIPILWRFVIPLGIIVLQNDLGTAMVYVFILFGMMFIAKVKIRFMLYILLAFAVIAVIAWFFMDDWRKNRILNFLDPSRDLENSGYNVSQAKIAIGSGLITGKGFFAAGALSQLDYIPENHTDFIFSVTIEAVGLIGGLLLIAMYAFLIVRIVRIAGKAKDEFGSLLCIGVACMLLFHIFENIGMNMGIMPVTGIPLPLFSYGGSNLITVMIGLGLVLNVNMRRVRIG